jgi:hypothetical protein
VTAADGFRELKNTYTAIVDPTVAWLFAENCYAFSNVGISIAGMKRLFGKTHPSHGTDADSSWNPMRLCSE